MRRLLFFTQSYPFSQGETFIENEIEYLSQAFDEIVILPWIGTGNATRQTPANCKILPPMLKNNRDTIISGIFCLAPVFYYIRHFFSEQAFRSFSHLKKYVSVVIFCRAILANKNFKQMNKEFQDDTIYFYWGIGSAYILPFIKNNKRKIVRFHGADLYLERRKNKYIPFRKEVYTHLTNAVYISQNGWNYAKEKYGQYLINSCYSYLGTTDFGSRTVIPQDSYIHILSCSNVIPVKRIHLILEALLLIKNTPIIWTHIGAGKEWSNLKKRTQQVPPNLQINLVGAMSNSDVIKYYQTEPIDIFVNVSSSEGLPVSIMEAISFDIPVLATNVGGTSEIVTQESGILIDVDFTPEILAAKIMELYKQRKSFHPRQFWQTHFSAAKNYPSFIKDILLG